MTAYQVNFPRIGVAVLLSLAPVAVDAQKDPPAPHHHQQAVGSNRCVFYDRSRNKKMCTLNVRRPLNSPCTCISGTTRYNGSIQ